MNYLKTVDEGFEQGGLRCLGENQEQREAGRKLLRDQAAKIDELAADAVRAAQRLASDVGMYADRVLAGNLASSPNIGSRACEVKHAHHQLATLTPLFRSCFRLLVGREFEVRS